MNVARLSGRSCSLPRPIADVSNSYRLKSRFTRFGTSMRSLRSRLLALWIMLVLSGAATAYLLFESFQQTANARVARSEELVARACRDIADRYQFFVSGWTGGRIDDRLKQDLTTLVQVALSSAIGVEGGVWQAGAGALAYAFPS